MENLDLDLVPEVLKVLRREYAAAREKHPIFAGSLYQAVSIVAEEAGELAQAVNDGDTREALREAAHVAVVAIRTMEMMMERAEEE